MKKTTLIIVALFAIVYAAMAQEKTKKTPEQKAEALTQKWSKTLSLSSEQVPKTKSIFLDRAQKVEAIRAKYPAEADKSKKRQEIKNVKTESDNALKQVFTPDQYAKYLQTKEENKKKKKDKTKEKNEEDESGSMED